MLSYRDHVRYLRWLILYFILRCFRESNDFWSEEYWQLLVGSRIRNPVRDNARAGVGGSRSVESSAAIVRGYSQRLL